MQNTESAINDISEEKLENNYSWPGNVRELQQHTWKGR